MREVGVGGPSLQLEPADYVEALVVDLYQIHCAAVVEGVDHPLGTGDPDLAQRTVRFDGLAGQIIDAIEALSAVPYSLPSTRTAPL